MNKKLIFLLFFICSPAYSAMYFNGSDQYVDLPNSPIIQISTPITISHWVYMTAYPPAAALTFTNNLTNATIYSGVWISLGPTGVVNVHCGNNTAGGPTGRISKAGTTLMQLNRWYNVICVIRTPVNMSIYVNGVDDGGTYSGSATTLVYGSRNGRLGNQGISAGWDYTGYLDDVRLYNRELSSAEIQSLALSRSRLNITDGLVGYWPLDDGNVSKTSTNANVMDRSGNDNHGTPSGAIWSGSSWISYP